MLLFGKDRMKQVAKVFSTITIVGRGLILSLGNWLDGWIDVVCYWWILFEWIIREELSL